MGQKGRDLAGRVSLALRGCADIDLVHVDHYVCGMNIIIVVYLDESNNLCDHVEFIRRFVAMHAIAMDLYPHEGVLTFVRHPGEEGDAAESAWLLGQEN